MVEWFVFDWIICRGQKLLYGTKSQAPTVNFFKTILATLIEAQQLGFAYSMVFLYNLKMKQRESTLSKVLILFTIGDMQGGQHMLHYFSNFNKLEQGVKGDATMDWLK
jgi:hypothetical protein